MMNREVKKKWLNALRSGDYPQGREFLQDSEGNYCCLGVLCETTGNASNRDMLQPFPINDPANELPKPFCGLSPKMQSKLAEMNDEGFTFEEIATYISRNVKAKD